MQFIALFLFDLHDNKCVTEFNLLTSVPSSHEIMQEMAPNFIQHLLNIGDSICSLDVLFDELLLQAGNHIVQYNWGKAGSCHGSSQGKVISRPLPMPN